DVHEGPVRVLEVEIEARELGADGAIRHPARQALSLVQNVAVLVPVGRKPDVVVAAAATILDNVDVPFVVDGEVVGVPQPAGNRSVGGQVEGLRRREQLDFGGGEVEGVDTAR